MNLSSDLAQSAEDDTKVLLDQFYGQEHRTEVTEDNKAFRHPLSLPDMSAIPDDEKMQSPAVLLPHETCDAVKATKDGKVSSPDQVGCEVLKKGSRVLIPYLHHLFSACVALRYYPQAFRFAKTLVIQKPDRDTYASASSWRPIALTSCIGKVLDKTLTSRFNQLIIENNLLPRNQFLAPGGSTVKALENCLATIFRGFVSVLHVFSSWSAPLTKAFSVQSAEITTRSDLSSQ